MDTIPPSRRSENMRRIRSAGTAPEMAVRRLVHSMGYRYRLRKKGLPGKPDLVFGPRRKVIFVHGCFWHQHTEPGCPIARSPKSNREYWVAKLNRNSERDAEQEDALCQAGWEALTLWECEIERDMASVGSKVRAFLENPER